MKAKKSARKKHLVKRKGHDEHYDDRKVYASVYAAAINSHKSEQESEHMAEEVMRKVSKWIDEQDSVTSSDIRKHIVQNIPDEDVKLMYRHHLDLC